MRNKKVLITGGTGGLGPAVVRKALEAGAQVILSYRSENEISALNSRFAPEEIEKITCLQADLMQEKEVQYLVSQIIYVPILIHLVGGFDMGPTVDFSLEKWTRQIQINLTSAFLICRSCLGPMYQNNYGRIVTIGSRSVVEPGAHMAAYSAAKAGLVAFTRSIAAETSGTRITANCVLPGIIDTPDNRRSMGDKDTDRWVKPESLAGLICYLASEAAQDIRGAAIPVYGNL